jgi:hypothetical protein
MTDLLVSVEDFKLWLKSEIPTDDNPYLQEALEAAQQTIQNACQRKFNAVGADAATARSFQPVGYCSKVLYIHDCTTITSVVDNGTTLVANTDYQAEPLNGLNSSGEAWPYFRLVKPWDAWYSATGFASVVVTAKWGWLETPAPILSAIRIIAKDEFNQRNTAGFGLVTVTEAGGVGTRENRIVREAVAQYGHPNAIGLG